MAEHEPVPSILHEWLWDNCHFEEGPVGSTWHVRPNEKQATDLVAQLDRAQWRRVEDVLPEYDTRVLVRLSNDPETQIGARILYNNIWFRIDSYAEHCNESDKVTHWRPLPEGPGE